MQSIASTNILIKKTKAYSRYWYFLFFLKNKPYNKRIRGIRGLNDHMTLNKKQIFLTMETWKWST